MPSKLLPLLLLAACGDDDDCPTGFLRDNDGNCLYVGDDSDTVDDDPTFGGPDPSDPGTSDPDPGSTSDEDDPPLPCTLTVAVDASCGGCFGGVGVTTYEWDYDTNRWSATIGRALVEPGEAMSESLVPSAASEVELSWSLAFDSNPVNPCGISPTSGTEFVECPPGSGESFLFNCD